MPDMTFLAFDLLLDRRTVCGVTLYPLDVVCTKIPPLRCAFTVPVTPSPCFIARFPPGSGFAGVLVLCSITFSCVRNEYKTFLVYVCGD